MSNEEKRILELERRVDWLYQMLAKQTKVNDALIYGIDGLTEITKANTEITKANTEILELHTKLFHDITDIMKD